LGEATKIAGFMLDEHKRYEVVVQLGVTTDTGDTDGAVIAQKPVPDLSESDIKRCLAKFTGSMAQIPPMYSALKHNGKKLYELARKGETIERKPRSINVFELRLTGFGQDWLALAVHCSKGTYIRSLAEDIGNDLGCGATVSQLRRTAVGPFDIANARTLEGLQLMNRQELHACLIDVDKPLGFLPAFALSREQAGCVVQGQPVNAGSRLPGLVRLYHAEAFLGLGEILMNGKLAPKRMFNMNIEYLNHKLMAHEA
jgi:tRNA pseudouridine55 synthase